MKAGDRCARCGEAFECGLSAGKKSCWCAEEPALIPLDESQSCLCPKCLRQEISSRVGLCLDCRHSRRLTSKSGRALFMCLLSESDPGYAKYPRLPMLNCAGCRELPMPGKKT